MKKNIILSSLLVIGQLVQSCSSSSELDGQWQLEDINVEDYLLLKPIEQHQVVLNEKKSFLEKNKGSMKFKFDSDGNFTENYVENGKEISNNGIFELSKDKRYITMINEGSAIKRYYLIVKNQNDSLYIRPVEKVGDDLNYVDLLYLRK